MSEIHESGGMSAGGRANLVVSPKGPVSGRPLRDGQPGGVTHITAAVAGDGGGDLAPVIAELREQHRQRQDLHRAEKSLTLQIKAKCRRLCDGDKKEADVLYRAMSGKGDHELAAVAFAANAPFIEARAVIAASRKVVEKRLEKLAKLLPVAGWVAETRGFGLPSLAAVIGECGNLSDYAGPAKVWRRMGLAVMPDGTRQRRVAGVEGMQHGYSPSRRSIAWNIGANFIKAGGPYRALYDERKAYEMARELPAGHAHNRAQRYVEKRLLRDLWRAWRDATESARPAPT